MNCKWINLDSCKVIYTTICQLSGLIWYAASGILMRRCCNAQHLTILQRWCQAPQLQLFDRRTLVLLYFVLLNFSYISLLLAVLSPFLFLFPVAGTGHCLLPPTPFHSHSAPTLATVPPQWQWPPPLPPTLWRQLIAPSPFPFLRLSGTAVAVAAVYISFGKHICSSVGYMLRNGITGSQSMDIYLAWEDTAKEFAKCLYQFILPPAMNDNSSFSLSSPTVGIVFFFHFNYSGGCVVVSYCGLLLLFVSFF